MNYKYDLTIAYRIYPRISKKPFVFSDDKFKLAHQCLSSFKSALGAVNAKIFVLLDGCPDLYAQLFSNIFSQDTLTLIRMPAVGNFKTFEKQIEILSAQNDSQLIYFAEDDYLYRENCFEKMITFMTRKLSVDFITPYDHFDYYSSFFHKNKQKIEYFEGNHWRTANSTTLTFLTQKRTLIKTKKIFLSYVRGCYDSAMWMSLTKSNILNPLYLMQYGVNESFLFKIYFLAWKYNLWHILFGHKFQLWAPLPSFATHVEDKGLAPGVNWHDYISER
jgi:hypothetical protein